MKKVMFAFLVIALLVGAMGIVAATEQANPKEYKALVKVQEQARDRLRDAIRDHRSLNVSGRNVTVKEMTDKQKEITAGKINARTGLNLSADDIDNKIVLKAYLSNGRWAYIKVMPDTASARALDRLRTKCLDRNCTVELKEVGEGNESKLAYEVKTQKNARALLLFKTKMPVRAQVDAETGEVLSVKKPWWASLVKEDDETPDVVETETETP